MNNLLFLNLHSVSNQSAFLDALIIFFAKTFPYLIIVFTILFLLFHHEVFQDQKPLKAFLIKWKEIIFSFIVGLSAWLFAYLFKYLFSTLRPYDQIENVLAIVDSSSIIQNWHILTEAYTIHKPSIYQTAIFLADKTITRLLCNNGTISGAGKVIVDVLEAHPYVEPSLRSSVGNNAFGAAQVVPGCIVPITLPDQRPRIAINYKSPYNIDNLTLRILPYICAHK